MVVDCDSVATRLRNLRVLRIKRIVDPSGVHRDLLGDQQIWPFTLFGKNEAADLTPAQKRQLRAAISVELQTRAAARKNQRRG
jgi:hypothetical protein